MTRHYECLLCRLVTQERRRHLGARHPIEAACFAREPDEDLRVFFSEIEIVN